MAFMARSYDAWMVGGLATMAIIYNTNISYAHDTTRACRYLGLCRSVDSVERLSVSHVDIDDGLSQALAHMTACYAIISVLPVTVATLSVIVHQTLTSFFSKSLRKHIGTFGN